MDCKAKSKNSLLTTIQYGLRTRNTFKTCNTKLSEMMMAVKNSVIKLKLYKNKIVFIKSKQKQQNQLLGRYGSEISLISLIRK